MRFGAFAISFVYLFSISTTSAISVECCHGSAHWRDRAANARALTRAAVLLEKSTLDLKQNALYLLASNELKKETGIADSASKEFSLETETSRTGPVISHPIGPKSKADLEKYKELLTRYKAALQTYMEHRKAVQQHVVNYHDQLQPQSDFGSNTQGDSQNNGAAVLSTPMEVPPVRGLRLTALDACEALQVAEQNLYSTELSVMGLIQYLMDNRKVLSPADYDSKWEMTGQRAMGLRNQVQAFEQGVVQKRDASESYMHGKMQSAIRDGDYVESQNVFGEEQRRTDLYHNEVKRARTHSDLAIQFLERLQAIGPGGKVNSSSNIVDYANQPMNADQFQDANVSLEQEYAQLQVLYQQVRAINPQFK